MVTSDSKHIGQFGAAALWPIYTFFGNQSKYDRAKPSQFAAHHTAYIPSVTDLLFALLRYWNLAPSFLIISKIGTFRCLVNRHLQAQLHISNVNYSIRFGICCLILSFCTRMSTELFSGVLMALHDASSPGSLHIQQTILKSKAFLIVNPYGILTCI